VDELWTAFKAKRLVGLRASTAREYERIFDVYISPELGEDRANEVRPREIKLVLNKVAETGPDMANRVRALLASIFGYAKDEFIVESNPVKDVKTPTKEKPRQRALDTEAELRGFFAAIEAMPCGAPIKVALAMILATAARPGEVCSMRRSDINFDAAVWTVPADIAKTDEARKVPLSAFALDLLERSKSFMLDAEIVFPSGRSGRPLLRATLSRISLGVSPFARTATPWCAR